MTVLIDNLSPEILHRRERDLRYSQKWQAQNPSRFTLYQREYHWRLKLEVIKAYGGKCVCCGDTTPEFLSVDHILGNGHKHREEVGKGSGFYHWLRKQGFPKEDFQLLCQNCNTAKGLYGACPHSIKVHEGEKIIIQKEELQCRR